MERDSQVRSPVTHALAVGVPLALAAAGCLPDQGESEVQTEEGVAVQNLQSGQGSGQTYLSMDLLATKGNGQAIPCKAGNVEVSVEVADGGAGKGSYKKVADGDVEVDCSARSGPDVALVLDNSGSQERVLGQTKTGAKNFAKAVTGQGGRVSMVRVSSYSEVKSPLTTDYKAVEQAIDGMFVNKGWTAFYDGIRQGNETLAAGAPKSPTAGGSQKKTPSSFASVQSYCQQAERRAIVAFTNGVDNNSGAQKSQHPKDDGIDTNFEDLKSLQVGSVSTPIYTIGLGSNVDHSVLARLSAKTGGRHLQLGGAKKIPAAFKLLKQYSPSAARVCLKMPKKTCGTTGVRVRYKYKADGKTYQGKREYTYEADCPAPKPSGRAASVLLTLSNPGIAKKTATTIATNAVDWAGDGSARKILAVRDDNHHNEFPGDIQYVSRLLKGAGYNVTYMKEPTKGLRPSDVKGYDLIWFGNPGYPIDDRRSFKTLQKAVGQGKGVVLSGDDMSWGMSGSFPTTPLVKLNHGSNGTRTCGERTDDNKGSSYRVAFSGGHPLAQGLAGTSFTYGDDIDHSQPAMAGESVVAWATLDGKPNCKVRTPAVVAFEP